MKKAIWKYQLNFGLQELDLPEGAEVLSAQPQDDQVTIWALVNPDAQVSKRAFEIFGTGYFIQCDLGIERKFINTVQRSDGLVFHVFERIN